MESLLEHFAKSYLGLIDQVWSPSIVIPPATVDVVRFVDQELIKMSHDAKPFHDVAKGYTCFALWLRAVFLARARRRVYQARILEPRNL